MRKILISAYACEPDKGSEPGVGWNWVIQISQTNEVWVLTRANNSGAITAYLKKHNINNIKFEYVSVPRWLSFWKKGQRGVRTYYYLWQFFACLHARKLKKHIQFDFAHHVTFVNDWLWTGLALTGIPFIWGPIGSHPYTPSHLIANKRTYITERLRTIVQVFMRTADPLYWLSCIRATRIIAINEQTANSFPLRVLSRNKIIITPAIGMNEVALFEKNKNETIRILYVGRFAPIKNPHLVIEAFARFLNTYKHDALLTMIGEGSELNDIASRIEQHNIGNNVSIIDWCNRSDVLNYMKNSDIFLFPSMESGGMVVLEALAHGLPVVCLNYGGPGTMVTNQCGYKTETNIPIDHIIDKLAISLIKLLDDDNRLNMSRAAKERVLTNYLWHHKNTLVDKIYTEALQ